MDASDLKGSVLLFIATLGVPYAIVAIACVIVAFRDTPNRRIATRNAMVYVLWCAVAGFLANFAFAVIPVRVALFATIAFGGVAVARLFDRER